jgi:hypothetical protein
VTTFVAQRSSYLDASKSAWAEVFSRLGGILPVFAKDSRPPKARERDAATLLAGVARYALELFDAQERERMQGRRVAVILSGGNVDTELFAQTLASS